MIVINTRYGGGVQSKARPASHGTRVADRVRLKSACHYLCVDCGCMTPQASADEAQAGTDNPPSTCGQCGGTEWADLREEAVVEQLHGTDHELAARPSGASQVASSLGLGLGVLVTSAAVVGGAVLFTSIFLDNYAGVQITKNSAGLALAGAFDFIIGTYALLAWILPAFRRSLRRPRRTAQRWRTFAPAAPQVAAPLTGRDCGGYEVAVRTTADAHAPAGTWLLVERCGDVSAKRERIEVDVSDEAVSTFLRCRGLDPTGLSLVFYERIAQPALS